MLKERYDRASQFIAFTFGALILVIVLLSIGYPLFNFILK